jgi:hypothetical protein
MPTPIDPDRGLRRDSRGNMLWETEDVLVETMHGPFMERKLIGQPNGGVQMRLGPGGMCIYMYNDDPGTYLNELGGVVSDRIAQAAGFDIDSLARSKRKKAAMRAAEIAVDEEFAAQGSHSKVVKERGEYRMVEIADGLFAIQFIEPDGKGTNLTKVPLARKAAEKLFDDMAGPEPEKA